MPPVAIVVVVIMRVRTGLSGAFSTSGLAGVAAAGLTVTNLDPVVAQQKPELAAQRHRLAQVREEERSPWHFGHRLPELILPR
jgi:hypothetical protein